MKVDIKRNILIPLVNQDDIQQKRQKKLAKAIANKDKALETFGLAIKVKRILREQKGKVQTKKPAHQQKEEEKIVIEEQRMKKKHEVPRPSLPVQTQNSTMVWVTDFE